MIREIRDFIDREKYNKIHPYLYFERINLKNIPNSYILTFENDTGGDFFLKDIIVRYNVLDSYINKKGGYPPDTHNLKYYVDINNNYDGTEPHEGTESDPLTYSEMMNLINNEDINSEGVDFFIRGIRIMDEPIYLTRDSASGTTLGYINWFMWDSYYSFIFPDTITGSEAIIYTHGESYIPFYYICDGVFIVRDYNFIVNNSMDNVCIIGFQNCFIYANNLHFPASQYFYIDNCSIFGSEVVWFDGGTILNCLIATISNPVENVVVFTGQEPTFIDSCALHCDRVSEGDIYNINSGAGVNGGTYIFTKWNEVDFWVLEGKTGLEILDFVNDKENFDLRKFQGNLPFSFYYYTPQPYIPYDFVGNAKYVRVGAGICTKAVNINVEDVLLTLSKSSSYFKYHTYIPAKTISSPCDNFNSSFVDAVGPVDNKANGLASKGSRLMSRKRYNWLIENGCELKLEIKPKNRYVVTEDFFVDIVINGYFVEERINV